MYWKEIFSLTLFKIITVSWSSTFLRVFPLGRSGCPAKKKNFFWGGVSLQAKTFELFPTVEYHPHQKIESTCLLITDHILEKKILIAFRQILSKILLEACIFSNTIMAYLKKKLIGTKFLSTKQYPAGLSPKIIPHCLLKHSWETLEMGENPTQQRKIYSFIPPEKSPYWNLLPPLSKVSFHPHEIVIFISLPCIIVVSFFNFRLYVRMCCANFD